MLHDVARTCMCCGVVEKADLFAPALDGVGLSPDRIIYAEAAKAKTVLMAMEEGMRMPGWRASLAN
jgi:hypothetical protein